MSDKKRLFQILDEMNVEDGQNNSETVGVCTAFVSSNKVKQGATITMGCPESALFDIMSGKVMPILLLVDKKTYFKKEKGE